jgi:hypothetical protein
MVLVGAAMSAAQLALTRRAERRGVFECALRPLDDVRARSWRNGVATVQAEGLRFRPGGPGGLRWPRGRPYLVELEAVGTGAPRRATGRERWRLTPSVRIMTLVAPGGRLELAASGGLLRRLRLEFPPIQGPGDAAD